MLLIKEEHLLRRRLVHRGQPRPRAVEPPIGILVVPAEIHPAVARLVLLDRIHLLQDRVPVRFLRRGWLPIILALVHVAHELGRVLVVRLHVALAAALRLLRGEGGFGFCAFLFQCRFRALRAQRFSCGTALGLLAARNGATANVAPVLT